MFMSIGFIGKVWPYKKQTNKQEHEKLNCSTGFLYYTKGDFF